MRIGKRETSRRLTGLTLPSFLGIGGGGITWTNDPGEIARARSVLRQLENRRVLYDPIAVENPSLCFPSVKEIRQELGRQIDQCQSAELRDPLRAIQAACRQFLTDTQGLDRDEPPFWIDDPNWRWRRTWKPSWLASRQDPVFASHKSWQFNQALGAFRTRVGISIAIIVNAFDIDVDEHLAKILPPPINEND